MMKAVVAHEYGAPEVLKFEEVPQPEPKGDEVLVRVIAGGVNPADPLTLGGKYAQEWGTHLPLIPGYEIAGIVEKTGAQVTTLKKGDAVYGYPNFGGGWAEYVDAVLDSVGRETLARSYGVVKKGGTVLDLVGRPDPVELEKHGIRGAAIWVRPDAKDLAEIAQLIDAGKIKPVVTQVLPLSEAIAAERQAETHHTRGKMVLRIADEPKG